MLKNHIAILFILLSVNLFAADLIEVLPVTNQILRLTFDEGYIKKHAYHQDSDEDQTFQWPLDLEKATDLLNYTIKSSNRKTINPIKLGSHTLW